jgi:hypothetical protein
MDATEIAPPATKRHGSQRMALLDHRAQANRRDADQGLWDRSLMLSDVARDGFTAPMFGKEGVVASSFTTKLQSHGNRAPDRGDAALRRAMAGPKSADED